MAEPYVNCQEKGEPKANSVRWSDACDGPISMAKNKMKMRQNEFYGNWRFAYLRWKLRDRQGEPVMSHALVDYAMHESVRTNRYWTFTTWSKVKLTIDHHNSTSVGQFITQPCFRFRFMCVRIQSPLSHRKNSIFVLKVENLRFFIWLFWIQWLMQITHRNGSPLSLLYLRPPSPCTFNSNDHRFSGNRTHKIIRSIPFSSLHFGCVSLLPLPMCSEP